MTVLLVVLAGYWGLGMGRLGWLVWKDRHRNVGMAGWQWVLVGVVLLPAAWVWPLSLLGDA